MRKKRTVYHVASHPEGWQVKREGAERASSVHHTKAEAVQTARERAENNKPSQVVIHRRDGTIEREWTYGQDPYPPKG